MAVPKKRTTKAARDSRRAQNSKRVAVQLVECPQCHEPKLPHRVCKACGYYKNTEVVEAK
jgi:large subunit ribosomal protein L32